MSVHENWVGGDRDVADAILSVRLFRLWVRAERGATCARTPAIKKSRAQCRA